MSAPARLERFRPRPQRIRYLLSYFTLFLGPLLAKIKVKRREHLPREGACILAINHFSVVDPAFVIYAVRKPINFLAASDQVIEWQNYWAAWLYGFIPTNRTRLAPSTIKMAVRVLKEKRILGIFPEGTSTSDQLRPPKMGVVYLSTVTSAPIIPIGITGLYNAWGQWLRGNRPRVEIKIGKAFGPFQLSKERKTREKQLEEIGKEVMRRIAALLPEKHHGAYRGDKEIEVYQQENQGCRVTRR